jgi:hypothetical protein
MRRRKIEVVVQPTSRNPDPARPGARRLGPVPDDAAPGAKGHERDEPGVEETIGPEQLAVGLARIATGAVLIAVATATELLRRTLGSPSPGHDDEGTPPAAVIAGASLALAVEAAALSVSVLRVGWSVARWGAWLLPTEGLRHVAEQAIERGNDRWTAKSTEAVEAATAFARELVPEITDALLDQLDLTDIVLDRVDLDRIVASVDLDTAVRNVDIDAIAGRIDLERVVARLDLDAIAARIDPNAIVDRVDLVRALDRVDATAIARDVIDELDLFTLIRETGETVTSEAVDDLRFGAVDADRAVARIVDRILRRRSARSVSVAEGSSEVDEDER